MMPMRTHAPVEHSGAGVARARDRSGGNRRGERRGDGDDRRDAERGEEGSGERGSALAERAARESDDCADGDGDQELVRVHCAPVDQPHYP